MTQATTLIPGRIQPRISDNLVSVIFNDQVSSQPHTISWQNRCRETESPTVRAILDNLEDKLPIGAVSSLTYIEIHRYGLGIRYRPLVRKRRFRKALVTDPRPVIEEIINGVLASAPDS